MSNKRQNKGAYAEKPREIPPTGWKEIGKRVYHQLSADHVQIVAAGIAFYFFLALFPAIIAMINIYSLVIDPAQIKEQFSALSNILPKQAYEIITGILEPVLSKPGSTLGWSLVISILVSLWSANKGTSALFEGLNIAYDEKDERGFIKKTGITFLFTIGAILMGLLSLMLLIFYPAFIDKIGLPSGLESFIDWGRWFLIAFLFIIALGMLYKNAPDRDDPEFKWVSWGAFISTVLWIGGSLLFSWYVENFGSYDKVYGSFAAVIILMLWLFITAFIILLGAEINSEMEHQTGKDTTIGEDEPMGQRDAYHADHIASNDREKQE